MAGSCSFPRGQNSSQEINLQVEGVKLTRGVESSGEGGGGLPLGGSLHKWVVLLEVGWVGRDSSDGTVNTPPGCSSCLIVLSLLLGLAL